MNWPNVRSIEVIRKAMRIETRNTCMSNVSWWMLVVPSNVKCETHDNTHFSMVVWIWHSFGCNSHFHCVRGRTAEGRVKMRECKAKQQRLKEYEEKKVRGKWWKWGKRREIKKRVSSENYHTVKSKLKEDTYFLGWLQCWWLQPSASKKAPFFFSVAGNDNMKGQSCGLMTTTILCRWQSLCIANIRIHSRTHTEQPTQPEMEPVLQRPTIKCTWW